MKENKLWIVSQSPKGKYRLSHSSRVVLVEAATPSEAKKLAGNLNEPGFNYYTAAFASLAVANTLVWL